MPIAGGAAEQERQAARVLRHVVDVGKRACGRSRRVARACAPSPPDPSRGSARCAASTPKLASGWLCAATTAGVRIAKIVGERRVLRRVRGKLADTASSAIGCFTLGRRVRRYFLKNLSSSTSAIFRQRSAWHTHHLSSGACRWCTRLRSACSYSTRYGSRPSGAVEATARCEEALGLLAVDRRRACAARAVLRIELLASSYMRQRIGRASEPALRGSRRRRRASRRCPGPRTRLGMRSIRRS